ncbi:MAG: DNA polymerase III subunit gamma/tau [Bacteroidetes bacterium HGW-Bacteroidetes-16]|jgi:DNA polymerase-3 subunit gamma/tau|nr:MAG: DNA polymerase III subunit gamma/tau [Bacteroidetes bacterium HGW-Bacteroidetes-16]
MENFIVSARKYRPATFHQVVGQHSITNTLQNAIKNNHLAQAFLFTGPRGVGKTTCARILAKTINCTHLTENLEPCDACESCTSFNNNASFNIHELDAASNNSVDDIRHLVEQVRIPPQVGKYKVYIIDEVHMLSQSAFNAFLKTLEEPPSYAKFILATTEKHKIIPTILSRCQIFDFRRINVEDIAQYLGYVASKENIETEPEALHIIAQKADGALRDALSTFDQIVSYSGHKMSYKNVIENLNILDYDYYFRITNDLLRYDIQELLLLFNEVIENGFDGQHFIMGLSDHLRSLLVIKNPATIKLMHASDQLKSKYMDQAMHCTPEFLFKALDICNQYDINYKASNNKRLHIEIALMTLAELTNSHPGATTLPPPPPLVREQTNTTAKENKIEYSAPPPVIAVPGKPIEQQVEKNIEVKPEITPVQKTNTETAATIKSQEPGNGKNIRNISIKAGLRSIKEQSISEENQPEPIIDNPFTQEKLEESWTRFCKSYEGISPSFANALAKYPPHLGSNNQITYTVDSIQIIQNSLSVNQLMEHLKRELNNNQITLHAIVPDKNQTKKAYTDRDKLERLIEKNPNVQKLKDQFNLEIGF